MSTPDWMKKMADELPALAQFLRQEHGPIGWEHQVGVWEQRLRGFMAGAARVPAAEAPGLPQLRVIEYELMCAAEEVAGGKDAARWDEMQRVPVALDMVRRLIGALRGAAQTAHTGEEK